MCALEKVTKKESFALKINGFRRLLGSESKRVKNAHFLARSVHDFFLNFYGLETLKEMLKRQGFADFRKRCKKSFKAAVESFANFLG